jgi:hypothetical protein
MQIHKERLWKLCIPVRITPCQSCLGITSDRSFNMCACVCPLKAFKRLKLNHPVGVQVLKLNRYNIPKSSFQHSQYGNRTNL